MVNSVTRTLRSDGLQCRRWFGGHPDCSRNRCRAISLGGRSAPRCERALSSATAELCSARKSRYTTASPTTRTTRQVNHSPLLLGRRTVNTTAARMVWNNASLFMVLVESISELILTVRGRQYNQCCTGTPCGGPGGIALLDWRFGVKAEDKQEDK